jgi:beta-mannosidase
MIRVWGGGSFMPEYFYQQCDNKRIMVWQDLMFANCMLPPSESLRQSILYEVQDNVRKLMAHECIVLWCGNNEINEGWENWGWKKLYSQSDSAVMFNFYNELFNKEIPNTIAKLDNKRPYIASSPKFGWGSKLSMSNADAHYWGVWWGKEPISNYYHKVPRFMSEYGMQSLPDLHSIMNMCDKRDINTDSVNFSNHQKATDGFDKLRYYMGSYPQHFDNLGYIYFSNLAQRDAVRTAIGAQRSAFPYCNGTMIWQLNDCWPAISWSIIDYFNRPKAAYYEMKDAYGENYLTLAKQVFENDRNIIDTNKFEYAFTICDATVNLTEPNVKTTAYVYDFNGELVYKTSNIEWKKNSAGVYYSTSFFEKESFKGFDWHMQYTVLEIQRYKQDYLKKPFFFAEPKVLMLPPAKCTYKWITDSTLYVTSDALAKDVMVRSSNSDSQFDTNYFTLLPNEGKEINVRNFNHLKDSIKVYSTVDFAY